MANKKGTTYRKPAGKLDSGFSTTLSEADGKRWVALATRRGVGTSVMVREAMLSFMNNPPA